MEIYSYAYRRLQEVNFQFVFFYKWLVTDFGDKNFWAVFSDVGDRSSLFNLRQFGFSFSDVGDNVEHQIGVTVMFVTSLYSWLNDVDHFKISVTKKYVGDIVIDQHQSTPECDVGDWYLMLVPNSRWWWRDLSPTSVTNIDVVHFSHYFANIAKVLF